MSEGQAHRDRVRRLEGGLGRRVAGKKAFLRPYDHQKDSHAGEQPLNGGAERAETVEAYYDEMVARARVAGAFFEQALFWGQRADDDILRAAASFQKSEHLPEAYAGVITDAAWRYIEQRKETERVLEHAAGAREFIKQHIGFEPKGDVGLSPGLFPLRIMCADSADFREAAARLGFPMQANERLEGGFYGVAIGNGAWIPVVLQPLDVMPEQPAQREQQLETVYLHERQHYFFNLFHCALRMRMGMKASPEPHGDTRRELEELGEFAGKEDVTKALVARVRPDMSLFLSNEACAMLLDGTAPDGALRSILIAQYARGFIQERVEEMRMYAVPNAALFDAAAVTAALEREAEAMIDTGLGAARELLGAGLPRTRVIGLLMSEPMPFWGKIVRRLKASGRWKGFVREATGG